MRDVEKRRGVGWGGGEEGKRGRDRGAREEYI